MHYTFCCYIQANKTCEDPSTEKIEKNKISITFSPSAWSIEYLHSFPLPYSYMELQSKRRDNVDWKDQPFRFKYSVGCDNQHILVTFLI